MELVFGLHPAEGATFESGGAEAVGIIETEHVGHGAGAGLALHARMFIVAHDVDGPALAGLDQHGVYPAALLEGAGVVVGHARHDLHGSLGVGHDGALSLAIAGHGGRKGRRGADESEEIPAGESVLGRQTMHVVVMGRHHAREELVVGRLLGLRRLNAFLQSPPEPRGLERAMFRESCLHRIIRGA